MFVFFVDLQKKVLEKKIYSTRRLEAYQSEDNVKISFTVELKDRAVSNISVEGSEEDQ